MAVGIRKIRASVARAEALLTRPRARRSRHRRERGPGRPTISRGLAIDTGLAVAAIVYSLLQSLLFLPLSLVAYGEPDAAPSGFLLVVVTTAEITAALSVLIRRRLPLVLAATSLTDLWLGGSGVTYPLAIYTLVVRGRTRWAVAVGLAGATVPLLDFLLITGERPPVPLFVQDTALDYLLPMLIAPALVATTVRTHRALIHSLRRRAEQLQREQELATRNARLEERARIARDIHDVVAHYVGLMVIQSGALEVGTAQESEAHKSARLLGDLGRRAMGELRDLLDVLRYEDGQGHDGYGDGPRGGEGEMSAASEATGAEAWRKDVAALVNEVRRAGVLATWQVSGEPERAGAAALRAAYRVIQEGIANAVRHAPGAEVRVSVAASAQSLEISVRNGPPAEPVGAPVEPRAPVDPRALVDPRAPGGPMSVSTTTGGGHGLIGIRERVSLLGGAVRAHATPQGGFSLTARIPATPATSAGPTAESATALAATASTGATGSSWSAAKSGAAESNVAEFPGSVPSGEPDDPGPAGGRRAAGASGHPSGAGIG
ncbi:sensor histidine kinase [Streptomyces sp. 7N604]|uniref:sensor histidine kinase n=1 Tax=Streptomyces sp. 7N604 TaxID=3457415 RepID=UPI003FD23613